MNDSERDVLRTLIREEVRAALAEHEANLAVARVRRSAALEELARLERKPGADALPGCSIGVPTAVGDLLRVGGWIA